MKEETIAGIFLCVVVIALALWTDSCARRDSESYCFQKTQRRECYKEFRYCEQSKKSGW